MSPNITSDTLHVFRTANLTDLMISSIKFEISLRLGMLRYELELVVELCAFIDKVDDKHYR